MRFYKYCGAGNDFILIENFDGALPQLSALAKQLCRRHFSVGADGLIVLEPAEHGGDCAMRFFNNDGSAAEMCGNGARCLTRHCLEHGISEGEARIETPAGMVCGRQTGVGCYRIALNSPTALRLGVKPEGCNTPEGCDYMELGENGIPHAVVLTDLSNLSEKRANLREFARKLRHASVFPRGANVNLCEVTDENEIRLLTFERGVEDFTLACGTGAGATVAALTLRGLVSGKNTRVQTDGGVLSVDYENGALFLTGPAELTFTGELGREARALL